jgi:hypothetical protein
MAAIQHQYILAAAHAGLPAKASKVVKPTNHGIDCLGIELTGSEHILAPRADKLDRLRLDTAAVLHRGRCTGREMAELVGRWTWMMLVKRPALAVFSSVYRFIQSAGPKVFNVWSSVARELYHAASLAPLLIATLSSSWCDHVYATDASMEAQGVVQAIVPPIITEIAARNNGSVQPMLSITMILIM